MQPIESRPRKVISISRRKFIIAVIVLAIIAAAAVITSKNSRVLTTDQNMSVGSVGGGRANNYPQAPESASMPYPDYYRGGEPTIDDTREFLKMSYSARLKTRDVPEAVKDVKNAVRDAEGRIDNMTSADKSGYVSFVVPKSRFDSFRDEVALITNARLYTETISSQNLLGEKQSLEQQAESAATYLASLEKQKSDLDDKHVKAVNSLKSELLAVQNQLAAVQYKLERTDDPNEINSLNSQEYSLAIREESLKQSLNSENQSYTSQSANLAPQIAQAKSMLAASGKQEVQFVNKIETVSGYVSVSWISWWGMVKTYSPIHPAIIIILVLVVGWYILYRRGILPIIALT